MSSDRLESLFAKLRQVRLAKPVNTGLSAVPVYTGLSSEASPIRILVDPCLERSIVATPSGGFAPLQIPVRLLLDPCLTTSVFAASFRAAFDSRRAAKSSPRRDLPIVETICSVKPSLSLIAANSGNSTSASNWSTC